MRTFSAGEAIGSGFRLIARNPMALVWWAGVYLVLGVLPQALAFWSALPDFLVFYQQVMRDALDGVRDPDMSGMMGLQSKMLLLQPIMIVSSLVSIAVLSGAIFRGVLSPEDRRRGYVRFSRQELWLGLSMAVLYILFILVFVALAIVVVVAVVIAAVVARQGGGDSIGGGLAIAVLLIAGLAVGLWVMLRLSLALPMSFARSNFLVFESWSLTRGHALKIFGVTLALFAMIMLLEMIVVGAVMAGWLGALSNGQGVRAFVEAAPEDLLHRMLVWAPVWMIGGALVSAPLHAILIAPYADIYRQLTAPEPAAP